jgi:hypothetical protein
VRADLNVKKLIVKDAVVLTMRWMEPGCQAFEYYLSAGCDEMTGELITVSICTGNFC